MKSERIPSLTTSVNNGQLLLLKPVDTEPLPLISGLLLVTATNGFSTPPFMLGEPIILSAVLETGDTTHNLFYMKNITETFFFRLGTDPETNPSSSPFLLKKNTDSRGQLLAH